MNCGQELFDYIKVTDSSEVTTRTGNVQYIQENCKVAGDRDDGYYNMTIRFGRLNVQSISFAGAEVALTAAEATAARGVTTTESRLSNLEDRVYTLENDVTVLFENQNLLYDLIFNQGVVQKWHITEEAIAPTPNYTVG